MRNLFLATLMGGLFLSCPASATAEPVGGAPIAGKPTVDRGIDLSVDYLLQARQFRDSGRYELARQAYAQAISTCRNEANLEIIRREMAGVELLIRTMR